MTPHKQRALSDLRATARNPVSRMGFDAAQRGLLALRDADLPRSPACAGRAGRAVPGKAPWDMRYAQVLLVAQASVLSEKGQRLAGAVIADIASCLDAQPSRADVAAAWPGEHCDDWPAGCAEYADAYERWELPWLAVHSAGVIGAPLFLIPDEDAWQAGEPIVRALGRVCSEHDFGDRKGSAMRHVGACIDCWSQATGIDVPNPTGVWVVRPGAGRLGWKNPRRTRTISRPLGRTGLL